MVATVSTASWHSAVTFSERLTVVMKMATSYQNAFPERTSSESQVEARTSESIIHQDALSKEDYYQRCNDLIETHNRLAKPPDQGEEISDANTPASASQEGPGQTIGPFKNCTHYTTGLFSTIYKTRLTNNTTKPQTLAIKLTTPSQSQPPHDPKREARILLSVKGHPNIISLLETHTLPPSHFLLIFPFLPLDLETLLNKPPLSKFLAKTLIHSISSALAHLHSLGIIHRDVKPSNILLSSPFSNNNCRAYLADFGIAWSPHDSASEPADQKITDVGTTCYRPPELLFGHKAYGCAVDLWAAGCVIAEIIHATTIHVQTTERRKNEWTLFNAGELGSELALVKSIFETLGTPTEETWPETKELPDWNKMSFVQFPGKAWDEILPDVDGQVRDLVSQLVRYQSTERMSAAEMVGVELWRDEGR